VVESSLSLDAPLLKADSHQFLGVALPPFGSAASPSVAKSWAASCQWQNKNSEIFKK